MFKTAFPDKCKNIILVLCARVKSKTNRTCSVKRQWYLLPDNSYEDVNFLTALAPGVSVCGALYVPVQQQLVLSRDLTFLTQPVLPLDVPVSVLQPPGLPLDTFVLIACAVLTCLLYSIQFFLPHSR